ncbi:MAG: 30S ribosomal protein S9 [Flavobacteriales bacterium]
METINTSGRRKSSTARVHVQKGKGKMTVNGKEHLEYFATPLLQEILDKPFRLTETQGQFDVKVNVNGGGLNGQAEATRLAISKALVQYDPENRERLKPYALLTRDPRMVERKKPGRRKARKSGQFSKR